MKADDVAVQMIMSEGVGVSADSAGVASVCVGGVEAGGAGAGGVRPPSAAVECGRRLLLAARDGDTDTVRHLITIGAPFTTDWLGTTPLHLAAGGGHLDTLVALLRGGVCRDSRTKVDRTPLHLAATHGHHRCVAALIGAGAKVDACDLLRMTPLHWAVQNDHVETAQLLLGAGADPEAESKFLKTPISLAAAAAQRGQPEMLRAIEAALAERSITQIHTKEAVDNTTLSSNEPKTYMISQEAVDSTAIRIQQASEPVAEGQPSAGAGAGEADVAEDIPCVNVESDGESGGVGGDGEGEAGEGEEGQAMDTGAGADTEGSGGVGEGAAAALLRRHGITLLPPDDGGTLLSALSSGRSIVLSDAGKLMLKESSANEVKRGVPLGGGGGAGVVVRAAPTPSPAPRGKVFTLAPGAKIVKPRQTAQKSELQEVKLIQQTVDKENKSSSSVSQPGGKGGQGDTQGEQSLRPAVRIIMNKHNFRKLIATATRASANDNGLLTEEDLELDSDSEESGGESGGEGVNSGGVRVTRGEREGDGGESVVTVPEQFVRSGSAQYLRSQLLCAHAAMHHLAHRLRRAKHKIKRLQHTHAHTNNNTGNY